jgi:hypothetical protein
MKVDSAITLLCVCMRNSPYQVSNAWTSLYETWYVSHDTWAHLNDVQHKSLPSVRVCMCMAYRC